MATFDIPNRPDSARPLTETPGDAPRTDWSWRIAALVILAGVVVGGYLAYSKWGGRSSNETSQFQTAEVKRQDLRILVTEDGNVESSANIDLKCKVEGGAQILWIIPDGTAVSKGTKLVSLSSAAIEEKITTQRILVERGRSTRTQAEEDLAVAEIALKEYLEGTFLKELQTAESAIAVQEQNLKAATNLLSHSETMFRKGHINKLQLDTNKDAVDRSRFDLDAAKTSRKVLVDFTRAKMVKQLEATRDAAKAKAEAERQAFQLEQDKLKRYQEQLSFCTISAPQDGTVIYANDMGGRGNQTVMIEEGAAVKEFQTILRLPDLSKMQVKALVHETKVGRLRPGMPANIVIRDQECKGTVSMVMSQAETGRSWMSSVKEYATFIRIDDAAKLTDLKPNMTAEVTILVRELKNVLAVQLQAVVEKGAKHYCYVLDRSSRGGYAEREVVIGDSNDKYLEIKDGVKDGDHVILNPRATIAMAREQVFAPDSASDLKMPTDVSPGDVPHSMPGKGKSKGPPGMGGESGSGGGPVLGKGGPGGPGGKGEPGKFDPAKAGELKRKKGGPPAGPQAEADSKKAPSTPAATEAPAPPAGAPAAPVKAAP
ncbi:MAG TPA: TolC family protein [Planctomycetia bacterium]|nr:TolC family protein [Planctomycetia bacterium]